MERQLCLCWPICLDLFYCNLFTVLFYRFSTRFFFGKNPECLKWLMTFSQIEIECTCHKNLSWHCQTMSDKFIFVWQALLFLKALAHRLPNRKWVQQTVSVWIWKVSQLQPGLINFFLFNLVCVSFLLFCLYIHINQ